MEQHVARIGGSGLLMQAEGRTTRHSVVAEETAALTP